jgi:hypothetical protein
VTDTAEYERLGDLDSPFAVTARHERAQRERERLRDAVRCDVAPLTYEAFQAGAPCPGCGRPYRDAEFWEFRGTINLNPEERARYDAEGERYAAMHGTCGLYRHNVSGSLTTHCGRCCPAPPLSPAQIEGLRGILGRPTAPHELMRWRLRLFCGHVVERQAHLTHRTLHAAFSGSVACPICGLDPAIIVDGAPVGPVGEPPESPAVPRPRRSKASRAELEMKVQVLEAEVGRLRSKRS